VTGGRCSLCLEWFSAEDGGCGCWAERHEASGLPVPERVETTTGEGYRCASGHTHLDMADACFCDLESGVAPRRID
jgi:hypothetical protein